MSHCSSVIFAKYATTLLLKESGSLFKKSTVNLTTSNATYTVEFTPTEKIEKGKVALLLGESELTTVSIDEVQIYEA